MAERVVAVVVVGRSELRACELNRREARDTTGIGSRDLQAEMQVPTGSAGRNNW